MMSDEGNAETELAARHREYLQHRNYLITTSLEQIGQFDKLIVTLSGGALALSLTFIKDISPNPNPASKWCVFAAWVFFTASLVSTLLSHLSSHKDADFEIDKLDESYARQDEIYNPENPYRKKTAVLNLLAVIGFLAGLALLVIFASVNFLG